MPTIKEIAQYTGFSASTVSIVLSGKSNARKIPETTQQIVLKAAKELNYRPNVSARRLRNAEFARRFIIAVFWSNDFLAPMITRFLKGIEEELERSGREVETIVRPYVSGNLHQAASLMEIQMFNAAIICNASEPAGRFRSLFRHGLFG